MKVSVSVVTYQHEHTARQAIDSTLRQETDFDFEVIIGDDASTDGTRDILKSYQGHARAPVKTLLPQANAGDAGLTNLLATIDSAEGEYIAFLDGDDYWTDPAKLQKQADFLDAHPECALCAHRVQHLQNNGKSALSPDAPQGSGSYDVGALILRNFAPKIATMVRRSALEDLPGWYRTSRALSMDWLLNVLAGRHGQIGFISEVMAVHRIHAASVCGTRGSARMFAEKLRLIPELQEFLPQKTNELQLLQRRLRWKQRTAQWAPGTFRVLKRLNELARLQPRT
jgi:glycosyltransferase involved in cell wall biosynthesis